MVGELAEGGSDFLDAGESQEAEGGVAEGGEILRGVAGLHLALVLAQGDVANPVEPILDPPVILPAGQQQRRIASGPIDAGNRVLDLDRLLTATGRGPFQAANLREAGPIEVLGQPRAGFQTPRDEPPVPLLNGAGFSQRLPSLLLGSGGKIRA